MSIGVIVFLIGVFLIGVLSSISWAMMRAASRQVPTPADRFRQFVPSREPMCWNCEKNPPAAAGLCDECAHKLYKMLRKMSA